MKSLKKTLLFLISMAILATGAHYGDLYLASPDLIISPVTPIPATVIQNKVISNIVYKVHNANATDTYPITFSNLSTQGITFTSTCENLAPNADCNINMTFDTHGISLGAYVHPFFILGAPKTYKYVLNSKVIPGAGNVNADANITLSDGGSAPSQMFTVTLTGSDSTPYTFNNIPLGKTELTPAIPPDTYTTHVDPSSINVSGSSYDAPLDGQVHIAQTGDTANFVYTKEQNVSVSTVITAPNLVSGGTVDVSCAGPQSYGPHAQLSGTHTFDVFYPGQYTCTASTYHGTDLKLYTPQITQPITIDYTHSQVVINYVETPPLTQTVSTNITAPNLPAGHTVRISIGDAFNVYSHEQAAGTTFYDNVADGVDYELSCDEYNIGAQYYQCTRKPPYIVDSAHTVIPIVYVPVAPPKQNYDWHVDHKNSLKTSNIFGVWWGGPQMTSLIKTASGPDANVELKQFVDTYELSPTPVQSTAVVQTLPSYIIQGSNSEYTTDVTNQFKAQQLDSGFTVEGNFDHDPQGSAGCFFDNDPGIQFAMNNGSGFVATVNTATYNVFTDYYEYHNTPIVTNITAPNLPDGTLLNIYITGPQGTYSHNQGVGSELFDNVIHGSYLLNAQSYVGTDGHTYNATLSNPYTLDDTHQTINLTYTETGDTIDAHPTTVFQPYKVFYYDGTVSSIVDTGGHNYVVTTVFKEVPYHKTPDTSLVKTFTFPATSGVSFNNTAPNLDLTETGTVNLNIQKQGMCNSIWYKNHTYTPQVDNLATQAADIATSTGKAFHPGIVMYTTRTEADPEYMIDDFQNDFTVTSGFYNLIYEAKKMRDHPSTNYILFLNPDMTNILTNCRQHSCKMAWDGFITQDPTTTVINNNNFKADINAALDALAANGHIEQAEANFIKALIPNTGSSMAAYYLMTEIAIQTVNEEVPYGFGLNFDDSDNNLLYGTPPVQGAPWETNDINWLHKINHLGYSDFHRLVYINYEALRMGQFLKDLDLLDHVGRGPYDPFYPKFYFFDKKFNQDSITAGLNHGYVFNGVDSDTAMDYLNALYPILYSISADNSPFALFQMPGATLQITGYTGSLADTLGDWMFGNITLNNDLSNVSTTIDLTTSFQGNLNNNVYFTKDSSVNNTRDYLKLTKDAP